MSERCTQPRILPLIVCCLTAAGLLPAQEDLDPRTVPVVTVGSEEISLRHLEDELLKQEGAEAVVELVDQQIGRTDWSGLEDDDVLVSMPGWVLPRVVVSATLLERHANTVREELINLSLVRQALADAGLEIDQAMLEREVQTMRTRFEDRLEREGKPWVAFENFIQETQGMPLQEWMQEPGFRVLAGIHHLLYERYDVPEDELRRFLRANYRDYLVAEAVDLSVMFLPFRSDDPRATIELAGTFHDSLRSGRMTWSKIWRVLNRGAAMPDEGRKGWVQRDGTAEIKGQADVPQVVIDRAFANLPEEDDQPVLLDPIVHEGGVSIVRVHAHRAAERPAFAQLRERLQRDYLDNDLDGYTKRYLAELRERYGIVYPQERSLAALIESRRRQALAVARRLVAELEAAGTQAGLGTDVPADTEQNTEQNTEQSAGR